MPNLPESMHTQLKHTVMRWDTLFKISLSKARQPPALQPPACKSQAVTLSVPHVSGLSFQGALFTWPKAPAPSTATRCKSPGLIFCAHVATFTIEQYDFCCGTARVLAVLDPSYVVTITGEHAHVQQTTHGLKLLSIRRLLLHTEQQLIFRV